MSKKTYGWRKSNWHKGTVANKWSKLMNLMNHFQSHKILDRLRLFWSAMIWFASFIKYWQSFFKLNAWCNRWSLVVIKPVDLFKSLVKTQLLQKQNFILVTTLYNPSTWCIDSGIVHLRKTSKGRTHRAFSRQKLTFILTGYRNALSLFICWLWANIQWGSSTTI